MTQNSPKPSQNQRKKATPGGSKWLEIIGLFSALVLFLVALSLMSQGSSKYGNEAALALLNTTSNPFIALFLGMLATALIQSSSAITSMVVRLVPATIGVGAVSFGMDISEAVPIIIGANIGTSVTSTLASLGFIMVKAEYRKAIAAATVHDFFNILTALVLLPLELVFGILSKPATLLSQHVSLPSGETGFYSILDRVIQPLSELVLKLLSYFPSQDNYVLFGLNLLTSLLLLFVALRLLTHFLKTLLIGRIQVKMEQSLFGKPLKGMLWGAGITALFQSSSAVTSLIVPLVATGKVRLERAFPFIMGANIGTTTTALIASLIVGSANPRAGVALALCHLGFNLIGVLIFLPFRRLRMVPIQLANRLGDLTIRNRLYGIAYIALVFFLFPFLMILLS